MATSRPVRVLGLVLIGLVLGGVCATAGVWQWNRFEWKRTANDELRQSAEASPVPVGDVLAPDRPVDEATEYRTVTATGTYAADEQVLVRRRQVEGKPGFLVLAPLRTGDGTTLVVNRGFIPATGAALDTPAIPAPPAGPVRLTGRVLPGEDGGLGSGLPDRQVQNVDVAELAARWDTRAYGGYVELVGSEPADTGLTPLPAPDLGNPAGGAVTGQHLAYVVQWFLFAAFALAGPAVLLLLDRRARRGRTPAPAREKQPA